MFSDVKKYKTYNLFVPIQYIQFSIAHRMHVFRFFCEFTRTIQVSYNVIVKYVVNLFNFLHVRDKKKFLHVRYGNSKHITSALPFWLLYFNIFFTSSFFCFLLNYLIIEKNLIKLAQLTKFL